MRYDMVKYERGQVWMIRFKNKESIGREQMKDRPWLILSVGKFNSSSGMITCAPITTRDEVVTPAHVLFTNNLQRKNVVLCEQIRTFDYKSGEYLLDYMGKLSDEIMEKVDVALSIHLGMHYSPITLKSLYDNMEAIVKSVSHMQEKENTKVFSDDDVKEFAEKLGSLVTKTPILVEPNPVETPIIVSTPAQEDIPDTQDIPEDNIAPEEIAPKKRKRKSWTPETCREFLSDCDKLPMKDVMDKWDISKKTRFYSTKNYVRSLLT